MKRSGRRRRNSGNKNSGKSGGFAFRIDDKLKQAEKKIAKKQSAAEVYYQQHKQQGFDPFELDQEEYDMYRMSKLKDHEEMPKEMKNNI